MAKRRRKQKRRKATTRGGTAQTTSSASVETIIQKALNELPAEASASDVEGWARKNYPYVEWTEDASARALQCCAAMRTREKRAKFLLVAFSVITTLVGLGTGMYCGIAFSAVWSTVRRWWGFGGVMALMLLAMSVCAFMFVPSGIGLLLRKPWAYRLADASLKAFVIPVVAVVLVLLYEQHGDPVANIETPAIVGYGLLLIWPILGIAILSLPSVKQQYCRDS